MLIAMGPSGRLRAREARRGDPFHCPVCIASVILRKGTIRIPHFAHKAHSTCIHTGKSQKHYEMQEKIHALLIQDSANNEVQLEKHFPAIGRVADVAFQRGGFTFVIECQVSPIDSREIRARDAAYARAGAEVLAEPAGSYSDLEKWLTETEQEGGEKMSPLVARLRDHWRKEDGPHALDGRWKDFMEIELGGNKIALTKGVRGGPAIQQLWRSSAFHRFIHASKPFAVLAILRFLRKHFEVNLAYLRRDVEGWLKLLAEQGVIVPVNTSKGIWRLRTVSGHDKE